MEVLFNPEKLFRYQSKKRMEFTTKEKAIEYAKNNNISFKLIEPNKKKFVIKSYADNFIKN